MRQKKAEANQSFLKGTMILTASVIIVKVIGAVFKIPLNIILGGVGAGYFSAAYELYSPLETLATAGFPIAISKLVSENMARGRYRDVRLIHRISIPLFFTTGTVCFIAMIAGSFLYVNVSQAPGTLYSALALSPTVLFVCLMSIYRGYYQGLKNMIPTAISEVIEALCKLIIGLSASYVVVKLFKNENVSYAAAAAIMGVTSGAAVGFIYLMFRFKKHGDGITKQQLRNAPKSIGAKKTMIRLMKIALPVGLGALVMSVAGLIDSTLIQRRINDIMHTNPQALLNMYKGNIPTYAVAENKVNSYLYGCFGYVTTITMIIPSLTQVFGISALPSVTSAWANGSVRQLKKSIDSVLRLTTMVTIPSGLMLAVMGDSIIRFMYENEKTYKETNIASNIIMIMGLAAIFTSMSTPICSMLQAVGRADLPVKLLSIGVVIKILLNYVLVGIPEINIQGAGTGTLCCYIFVTAAALYFLFKETRIVPNLVTIFLKPLLASIVMCILGKLSEKLLMPFLPFRISIVISLFVAAVIYVVMLFLLRSIKKSDILMLPKGEKIARVLEKYNFMR